MAPPTTDHVEAIMGVPRWILILLMVLMAVPVRAQDPKPAAPDFSGVWAHMTWPDFEPPSNGPGPITNRSHRDGIPDIFELVGDYASPILKPYAAEIIKQHGDISRTGAYYP